MCKVKASENQQQKIETTELISILLQNFTNLYKNIHFIAYFFETRFLKFIAYNSAFSGKEIATEGKTNRNACIRVQIKITSKNISACRGIYKPTCRSGGQHTMK